MTGLQCQSCVLPHEWLVLLASLHVTLGLVHVPGRIDHISQSRHQAGDKALIVVTNVHYLCCVLSCGNQQVLGSYELLLGP